MKKLNKSGFAGIAAAALLAVVGLAPTANAQLTLVGSNGASYIINFDGYSMGTVYTAAAGDYGSSNPATGVALMDAVAKLDQRPLTADFTPGAIGSEDTWGILRVSSIVSGGNTVWQAAADGSGGPQIRGMFYGGADYQARILADGTQIFNSVGFHLDLYLSNTTTTWGSVRNQLELGRIDADSYTNVTTVGSQILGSQGLAGFFIDSLPAFTDADAHFRSQFLENGTANGSGRVAINSQNINPPLGPIADFTFTNNSNPLEALGWTVFLNGNATGTLVPVPEPSTYGLIAAGGLLALVAFRRMKARAQAV
jgi:hypothetical protein